MVREVVGALFFGVLDMGISRIVVVFNLRYVISNYARSHDPVAGKHISNDRSTTYHLNKIRLTPRAV